MSITDLDDTYTRVGVPRVAAARARAAGARLSPTCADTIAVTLPDGTCTHFSQREGGARLNAHRSAGTPSPRTETTLVAFLHGYADDHDTAEPATDDRDRAVRDLANTIAGQAAAIAAGTVIGPRHAAVARLVSNAQMLAAWTPDDRA